MKRFLILIALGVATIVWTVPAESSAETIHDCTELPPIAWDSAPTATVRVVIDIALPRVTSAKELYLNAMCGAQPAAVWDLVTRGEGGVLEIPQPLADALDAAVPYMPRVDYMYVRGGGLDREVAVVLFANGYDGPFFELDRSGDDFPWTAEMVADAAEVWDALPYDIVRRASHWLHDVALFDEEYTVHLRALAGLIDITVFTQTGGRGLATWLGTLFASDQNTAHPLHFWAHEIGHYVDYETNGVHSFAYAPEGSFQGISRENNRILGIPVPFWFRLRHEAAREWLAEQGGCENAASWSGLPWGFATAYGICGEMSGEDFADSLVLALGVTQEIRESDYQQSPWNRYAGGYFAPSRLFDRTGAPDASVMAQKVDYIYERFAIHSSLPQDADQDGVTYVRGMEIGDCSDINPVDGLCEATGCDDDVDCDDGEPCTVDACREGQCVRTIRDSDGDGSPDAACGGPDCDDADPAIAVGSIRPCQGACGIDGEQQCVAGGWTECSAPESCECDPAEPPEVVPCGNCGTRERHCRADGTWAPLTACEPIDPTADGCSPGETRVTDAGCLDEVCAGQTISRDREETCDASCNWIETRECTLTQPTSAEVCNGDDDDCDGDLDEGCVDDLSFVGQAPQPLIMGDYPYGDGYPNETNCPAGHALVGFRVTDATFTFGLSSYRVLGALEPRCRPVELTTSLVGGTYDYSVTTGSGLVELATHGDYDVFHDSFTCPAGQFVRGISVQQGWFIDRIKVHCGEFAVDGDIGSYTLDRHDGVSSTPMVAGTELNAHQHCHGEGIATGLRTRTGDVVDGIALNCTDVALTLQ